MSSGDFRATRFVPVFSFLLALARFKAANDVTPLAVGKHKGQATARRRRPLHGLAGRGQFTRRRLYHLSPGTRASFCFVLFYLFSDRTSTAANPSLETLFGCARSTASPLCTLSVEPDCIFS